MTLVPAPAELADFAAASRPDWERDRIDGVFQAARTSQVPWPRFLAVFWLALTDEKASPRAILDAIRDPLERDGGTGPTEGFTAARVALEQELAAEPGDAA